MDKPWCWTHLSHNHSITSEFIERHLDKPWYWTSLSDNPSIRPSFIESHLDKPWDWDRLSTNIFLEHWYFKSKAYIGKQKIIMFNQIKDELLEIAWHPTRFKEWCLDMEESESISKVWMN